MNRIVRYTLTCFIVSSCLFCSCQNVKDSKTKAAVAVSDSIKAVTANRLILEKNDSLSLLPRFYPFVDEDGNNYYAYYDEDEDMHLFDEDGDLLTKSDILSSNLTLYDRSGNIMTAHIDALGTFLVAPELVGLPDQRIICDV